MNRFATVAASIAFAAGMAAPAAAVTITPETVDCALENFTVSIACHGDFTTANPGGVVSGTDLDGLFLADGVAITGWNELQKIDLPDTTGPIFSITNMGDSSGTWSLNPLYMFDPNEFYIFTLKGATEQVAYLMNPEFFAGTWNNNDLGYTNPGGQWNLPGLSNIALWSTGDIAPIPLPAGVWLLLSALGVFGLLRRRQLRTSTA